MVVPYGCGMLNKWYIPHTHRVCHPQTYLLLVSDAAAHASGAAAAVVVGAVDGVPPCATSSGRSRGAWHTAHSSGVECGASGRFSSCALGTSVAVTLSAAAPLSAAPTAGTMAVARVASAVAAPA